MKNFMQWVEDNKLELPVFVDATPENTDTETGEETTDENRARTGASANYPDAYVRSQYPHKWFNPKIATADLDLKGAKKKS